MAPDRGPGQAPPVRHDHMQGFVYIMANEKNGTIYLGVTNDLVRRVQEHKEGKVEGFTKKYVLKRLVYYEAGGGITDAIAREKQLKNWHRDWKIRLIEEKNPCWEDLYDEIRGG